MAKRNWIERKNSFDLELLSEGKSKDDWSKEFEGKVADDDNILEKVFYYLKSNKNKKYKIKVLKTSEDIVMLTHANKKSKKLKLSKFNPESFCLFLKFIIQTQILSKYPMIAIFVSLPKIKKTVCIIKDKKGVCIAELDTDLIELSCSSVAAYRYK